MIFVAELQRCSGVGEHHFCISFLRAFKSTSHPIDELCDENFRKCNVNCEWSIFAVNHLMT